MTQTKRFTEIALDDAWQMIQCIPSHDRDTWIKVGMAIKSEFGNDAFSIFDQWSNTADNYNSKSVKSVWRSFKGSGISIGSLVHLAVENGWQIESKESFKLPAPKKQIPPVQNKSTSSYALKLNISASSSDQYVSSHKYAKAKGIISAGGAGRGRASGSIIGKDSDCIIVPIRTIKTNKVQGVQCINPDGKKQTFGSVSEGGLLLGNTLNKSIIWYVCEGWASAYSVVFHHQNGNGVCACSFGKGNQNKVSQKIAEIYQPDRIVILMEDDS